MEVAGAADVWGLRKGLAAAGCVALFCGCWVPKGEGLLVWPNAGVCDDAVPPKGFDCAGACVDACCG